MTAFRLCAARRIGALLVGLSIFWLGAGRAPAGDSLADVDAAARAAGNRPALARALGDVLFSGQWAAQITKVRIDGAGRHTIAGLVISGLKFHRPLDPSAFLDEIDTLVRTTFANSPVEEVDVWATVPLPTHAHEIVAGDLAMPTSRDVFAVSALRSEGAAFPGRLRAGRDVYWDAAWRASLTTR